MSFLRAVGKIVATAIAARITDRIVDALFHKKEPFAYNPPNRLRRYTKEMFVNGTYVGDKRADEILARLKEEEGKTGSAATENAKPASTFSGKAKPADAVGEELASALGQFVHRAHRVEKYGSGACFNYKESFCMLGEILHEIQFMAPEHHNAIDSFLSFIEKSIHNEAMLKEAAQELIRAVT